MKIDFDQSKPIYLQIIDEVRRQIATSELKPGDKMPSQRDLAAQLHVNANTVQRAYREMEMLGMVETLRGQGTFICQEHSIVEETRTEMVNELLENFISAMRALGIEEKAIIALVEAKLTTNQQDGRVTSD